MGDYGNYGSGDYGYSGYSGYSGFYGPTGSGYYTTAYPTAAGRGDYSMGLVEFAERYTCPMHCMLEGLDLTYEEDGWPSIPKITEFFADSPMDKDQIGKCFCEGMKAKAVRVLKDLAQMGSAGEELGMRSALPMMRGDDFDPSMLEGIIDITELPKMFKQLGDEEQEHVTDLIKFAVFNHCIHDAYMDVCPQEFQG